ncbi:MAG: response regulator [Candidatus Zixiibacteriota bacterium]
MGKRILVVDDNPNMSSLLCEMLEVFDYQSVHASDGNEALAELAKGDFSMVITDMRMPNMTGLELLKEVKDRHPKLPVVLISGYSVNEIASMGGELKPDGFLGKPLMMSDIERLLNTLL